MKERSQESMGEGSALEELAHPTYVRCTQLDQKDMSIKKKLAGDIHTYVLYFAISFWVMQLWYWQ